MDLKDNPALPSYYTILPACIRLNPNIIPGARLLWSDISVLSLKNGYCYSTNAFFARIYGVNIRTVNTWVSNLKHLELVTIEHFKTGDGNNVIRHIRPNTSHPELAVFLQTKEKNCVRRMKKICNQPMQKKAQRIIQASIILG